MGDSPSKAAVCARCGGPGTGNLTPSGTLVCNECIRLVLAEPVKFDDDDKPLPLHEKTMALAGLIVGAGLMVAGFAAGMSLAMEGAWRLPVRLMAAVSAGGLVVLVYSIRKLRNR